MDVHSADYFTQVQQTGGWRTILESFARFVKPDHLTSTSRILDVGCGPAALITIFQGVSAASVWGADTDLQMLAAAYQQHGETVTGKLAVGALPHLPYADQTFDLITATNVIYLLADPLSAVQNIARLLKPQGQLVMLNPSEAMNRAAALALADEKNLSGFARDNFIHWGEVAEANYRWSEADLVELFASANLRLAETALRVGSGLARYARAIKD